jgi:hypothetical protein
MADKSVAQKLLIKPGSALWVEPEDGRFLIGPLPEDVPPASSLTDARTAVIFVAEEAALRAAIDAHGSSLMGVPVLWFAYPKGGRSDLDRDRLWPIVGEVGLRPIGQVAIDDVWSALRFRPLAPGEPPFQGR